MPRQRHCSQCGQWHALDQWPAACMKERRTPSPFLSAPMVVTDAMEPVQSMLDGKIYDSKAALRRTYKQAGVTEVGNDSSVLEPKPFKKPRPDRKEVRASIDRAFSRAGLGA